MAGTSIVIGQLLAVVGVDDAIVLGVGAVALAFAKRQCRLKAEFLARHKEQIDMENEEIADRWRA